MISVLLHIVVVLIVVGVLLWAISQFPLDATLARIIRVVAIVFVVLWLLYVLVGLVPLR